MFDEKKIFEIIKNNNGVSNFDIGRILNCSSLGIDDFIFYKLGDLCVRNEFKKWIVIVVFVSSVF